MNIMTHPVALLLSIVLALGAMLNGSSLLDGPDSVESTVTDDLDAFWAELARTVEEGDFEGYAATYHEDAVVVMSDQRATFPIEAALADWKSGFDDTAAGRMTAGVDFRFSQRLNDETTAHETGIFRYRYRLEGQDEAVAMVHFEGLLVKRGGRWLMTMEYQKQLAAQAEWDALAE